MHGQQRPGQGQARFPRARGRCSVLFTKIWDKKGGNGKWRRLFVNMTQATPPVYAILLDLGRFARSSTSKTTTKI